MKKLNKSNKKLAKRLTTYGCWCTCGWCSCTCTGVGANHNASGIHSNRNHGLNTNATSDVRVTLMR